jgi:hypothetical protein
VRTTQTLLQAAILALVLVTAVYGGSIVGVSPPGASAAIAAFTIGFDDLPGAQGAIPNGYKGFTWNNFWYVDGVNYYDNPSGYQNGVRSANNVAFNAYGNPASIYASSPWYVIDGYVTAAWRDDLEISIVGSLAGNPVISGDFFIGPLGTTYFYATGVVWIDTLTFTTSGGTQHWPGRGDGTHFALEDFQVYQIPEPGTVVLMGIGLLALGFVRRRK